MGSSTRILALAGVALAAAACSSESAPEAGRRRPPRRRSWPCRPTLRRPTASPRSATTIRPAACTSTTTCRTGATAASGAPKAHRTLEILLRSTPSGATAAVDGLVIGRTPTYWEGPFTGRQHEFTFVLPGYAMARYRFVPISNGVVHGRLTRIVGEPDAGAPAAPVPGGRADEPAASTGRSRHRPAPHRPAEAPEARPGGARRAAGRADARTSGRRSPTIPLPALPAPPDARR